MAYYLQMLDLCSHFIDLFTKVYEKISVKEGHE